MLGHQIASIVVVELNYDMIFSAHNVSHRKIRDAVGLVLMMPL